MRQSRLRYEWCFDTYCSRCTEVTSADPDDCCNLASINLSRIETIDELKDVVSLVTKFLICGTIVGHVPYEAIAKTQNKNRRLGLGLMGIHEWLLQRGYPYEVVPELHKWLTVYKRESDATSAAFADALGVSRPVANRAIAPTGTLGILAGTSTGIEPIFAVAYKRRFVGGDNKWRYQYVVDGSARDLIDRYGVDPNKMAKDTALELANDYERRIKFQADVQDYVDMAISSTINLPAWGSTFNNEDTVSDFANTLARYAHRLRGFTCYADGSRGGQPLSPVDYNEAISKLGETFEENIEFADACKGGVCGI